MSECKESTNVAAMINVYSGDLLEPLIEALESIWNQDYRQGDIRVYLGIDGPIPPDIEAYIAENRQRFYKIVRSETNTGHARAANRLIEALEDERYAMRMDADDISLPYRFRVQVDHMEANPDVAVVGGGIIEFDEERQVTFVRSYPPDTAAAKKYICLASPMAQPTVCFRRDIFEGDDPIRYDENRFPEDLSLWFEMLKRGMHLGNIDVPVLYFRMYQSVGRRRGIRSAWTLLRTSARGILSLHGPTWRLCFPAAKFFFRLMPRRAISYLYRSGLRRMLNVNRGESTSKQTEVSKTTRHIVVDYQGDSEKTLKMIELLESCDIDANRARELVSNSDCCPERASVF